MNRFGTSIAILATTVFAAGLAGCSSQTPNAGTARPADQATGSHDHAEHDAHSHHSAADMETMKAELAKMSPEDAASAEKQHVCPVSGEILGTMGAPKKMDVKGQQVWICCDGCRDKLLANPETYLAKLKKE